MHNINEEFCLEIYIINVFSVNRLDFKVLCFKTSHFEDIYNVN